MSAASVKKAIYIALALLGLWLSIRFVLPVALPFLVGALLAVAAEPAVSFGVQRLRLSRGLAAGLGVTVSMVLLAALLTLIGAISVRQLGSLAGKLPDLTAQAQNLEDWLLTAADNAPEGVRALAQRTVLEVFDGGATVMEQFAGKVPSMLTTVVSGVGNSVLGIGTAILAAFLISARLPKLRQGIARRLPASWHEKYLPALKRVRSSLGLWLKAQGKLALVTWGIVTAGFFVIRIGNAPLWAALVALVDAIPILGTGTILVPWGVVCLLQGQTARGIGLLVIYAAAAVTRTVLEPRMVGRHLGLDPLMTLAALYVGYRLWGIPGLLFTPILASAVKSAIASES